MGSVYLAEQNLGATVRKVAVKTLHAHLSQDEAIRTRFQREVSTVAALEHPNTIRVFDFGTSDAGQLFIVMELVQGQSLGDALTAAKRFSPERTKKILAQVCGALGEAHELGIVHRDLKPDNIILTSRAGQEDFVKLLDFGIAKRESATSADQKLTQQGTVLGTPPYMSPEQFTGTSVDARSDIYALGVMAYEMLTGELPFSANTAWEWATQHMRMAPKPIEGEVVPRPMRKAIERALSKAPDARFPTVAAFIEAFAAERTTDPGAPLALASVLPVAPAAPLKPRADRPRSARPMSRPPRPATPPRRSPPLHSPPLRRRSARWPPPQGEPSRGLRPWMRSRPPRRPRTPAGRASAARPTARRPPTVQPAGLTRLCTAPPCTTAARPPRHGEARGSSSGLGSSRSSASRPSSSPRPGWEMGSSRRRPRRRQVSPSASPPRRRPPRRPSRPARSRPPRTLTRPSTPPPPPRQRSRRRPPSRLGSPPGLARSPRGPALRLRRRQPRRLRRRQLRRLRRRPRRRSRSRSRSRRCSLRRRLRIRHRPPRPSA